MAFAKSLVSKKLIVTGAAVGLVQSLPMTADWKGICTAAIALAFVIAQAYVDASMPAPVATPKPETPPPAEGA